jgi:hypothetical protein
LSKGVWKTEGGEMSAFTFEIVRQGERPVIANVMTMLDDRAVWCQVEALALRVQDGDGAFIQVKNSKGENVIRAGIATARISIETCSCGTCPLKKGLERRGSGGSHAATDLSVDFIPCETRGGRSRNLGEL